MLSCGNEPKRLRLGAMEEALLAIDTLNIQLWPGLASLSGAVLRTDRDRCGHPPADKIYPHVRDAGASGLAGFQSG